LIFAPALYLLRAYEFYIAILVEKLCEGRQTTAKLRSSLVPDSAQAGLHSRHSSATENVKECQNVLIPPIKLFGKPEIEKALADFAKR